MLVKNTFKCPSCKKLIKELIKKTYPAQPIKCTYCALEMECQENNMLFIKSRWFLPSNSGVVKESEQDMTKCIASCKNACSDDCPSIYLHAFKRYCDVKYSVINNEHIDEITSAEWDELDATCTQCNVFVEGV